MDRQTERQTDRKTDGWMMDGQTDRRKVMKNERQLIHWQASREIDRR
jgi:hypothetical protein